MVYTLYRLSAYKVLVHSYRHFTDKKLASVVCDHTVSMQWRQGSNAGRPTLKRVLPSPTVCAGPVFPPPKIAWSGSKCWQASRVGPSNNNPAEISPKSSRLAHQHLHLQTRSGAEYGGGTIKRALHTLLKSQALLKTSAWNCVPLIEMKNKLRCQATAGRGQEEN